MNEYIGKKIKELRTNKKMTLKELSEKTNLSTGFLSQLERGLTSIATDSLNDIANVLNVNISSFFVSYEQNNKYVVKNYEKKVSEIINSRFINYSLTNESENSLVPRLVELLPINCNEDISEYSHDGEEFIYVLEGILTLFVNNEKFELYPGDTAHYKSSIVHNWANYTNRMVKILVVSI